MAYRPAQVWTGSAWDDVGDKRLTTHTHAGGANGVNIAQSSVTNLTTDLGNKSNNPKTVDTKTANYTLVLGDRDKIVQMNSASNLTITVPTNASAAFPVGTIVHVANINTGTLTIAGASGATVNQAGGLTLSQWESGSLYQRAANNWVFLKGGGLGAANFSNTSTGTYTDGGFSYKYVTFTGNGTLTVTKAGFADVLVIGGGGAGGASNGGGGGAGGYLSASNVYLPAGSETVVVGAGGVSQSPSAAPGNNGVASRIGNYYAVGGGGGGFNTGGGHLSIGLNGGSGGGGGGGIAGGSGTSGQGNAGNGTTNPNGGGGAGAASTGTAGGAGLASSITGTSVTRAGGGGLTGGSGGGGGLSTSGTANTGSGGGPFDGISPAGNGGSGIVIIRVRTA